MTITESSRSLLVVLALGAAGSSAASACPADPFAAFRADFNQANAAWARDGDNVHVADGQLVLKPDLNSGWRLPIPSFKLAAGAYCAEIKSPMGPDDAHAGVLLWMTDAANLLTATVAPDGTFQIRHKKENVWKTLLARTGPKLKTGPGAVNEVRVVTKKIVDVAVVGDTRIPLSKSSVLALYLNGGFVADMDMEAPKDGGSFGLYAQSARQQRSEWRVLSFSATPLPLEPRAALQGNRHRRRFELRGDGNGRGDRRQLCGRVVNRQAIDQRHGRVARRHILGRVPERRQGRACDLWSRGHRLERQANRVRRGRAGRHRDLAATAATVIAEPAVAQRCTTGADDECDQAGRLGWWHLSPCKPSPRKRRRGAQRPRARPSGTISRARARSGASTAITATSSTDNSR